MKSWAEVGKLVNVTQNVVACSSLRPPMNERARTRMGLFACGLGHYTKSSLAVSILASCWSPNEVLPLCFFFAVDVLLHFSHFF